MNGKKILFIDITVPRKTAFIRSAPERVFRIFRHKNNSSLLPRLVKFLEEQKIFLKDIGGIFLLEGGGSFSGVRAAAAVLNAISFASGTPVFGLDKRLYGDDWKKIFAEAEKKICPPFQNNIIKPIYPASPKVTPHARNLRRFDKG